MATSNAAGIRLPQAAVKQLEMLLKYIDRLLDILRESKNLEYGITLFQVLEPFSTRIGIPLDDLQDIFYALENLRSLAVEFGSPENVLIRLSDVKQDVAKRLEENKDRLLQAISEYQPDDPVAITFKAQRLTYLHERIYRDAEIITDIRPVFDGAGKNVLEVIISHSLVASITVSGRTERISLAMDAGDVVKLRAACDRAIEKAKSLNSALNGSDLKWKVQILRGQDDGAL
jgi:hypothetical protein